MAERIWPGYLHFFFSALLLMLMAGLTLGLIGIGKTDTITLLLLCVLIAIPALGIYCSSRTYAISDGFIEIRNLLPMDSERIPLGKIMRVDVKEWLPDRIGR
ncbi:MAG: hypothetical protein AB1529_05180 [Candidatus Micrarchaeota archaeon]